MNNPRTIAIISYIFLPGFIVALIMHSENKSHMAAFHLRQNLGLMIIGFALSVVAVVPILGTLVAAIGGIVLFAFWLMGLLSAVNDEVKPVPLVGEWIQQTFSSIF